MQKYILYILIIIAIVGLFSPVIQIGATACTGPNTPAGCTPADTKYKLLAPLPDSASQGGTMSDFDPTGDNKIGGYLNTMIKLFIGICAVLSVIMIVIGGIEYMTTELISGKEAGKERIIHAILGLLLALGAWTLLYTINPELLNIKI